MERRSAGVEEWKKMMEGGSGPGCLNSLVRCFGLFTQ
jgi:hypothetical protein